MTIYLSDAEEARLMVRFREVIQEAQLGRTCLRCRAFDEGTEACANAGGARPPARVIVYGCEKFSQNPPF